MFDFTKKSFCLKFSKLFIFCPLRSHVSISLDASSPLVRFSFMSPMLYSKLEHFMCEAQLMHNRWPLPSVRHAPPPPPLPHSLYSTCYCIVEKLNNLLCKNFTIAYGKDPKKLNKLSIVHFSNPSWWPGLQTKPVYNNRQNPLQHYPGWSHFWYWTPNYFWPSLPRWQGTTVHF